ncbi:hypothetical protein [Bacillus sp. GB_SG_008]|uniref:hypothetical protein n=1 Tax=Bacillus sp. GB_SG_008 TaxID=3454627 RepID=UPI003F82AEC9
MSLKNIEDSTWFKEHWFLKSVFTIVMSQIGIIMIIFFVGPSRDISFSESISNYLLKGSLFLSSLSIASNLISIYFFDKREENKELVFEINKVGLAFLIVIVCSAGIAYAVMPPTFNPYFMFIQIVIYLTLMYWIFKINHIIQNKESYSKEMDKKGNETMESAKKVSEYKGISL